MNKLAFSETISELETSIDNFRGQKLTPKQYDKLMELLDYFQTSVIAPAVTHDLLKDFNEDS